MAQANKSNSTGTSRSETKPNQSTSNSQSNDVGAGETESQIAAKEKIKEVFKRFDRDRNGVLSRQEVQRLMKSIGGAITPEEIDKVFEQVDSNGDDVVDIDEFIEWVMSPGSRLQVQDDGDVTQFDLVSVLKPLFQVYDTSNNGSVSLDEFREMHSILQGAIRAAHADEQDVLLAQEVGAYDEVERVFHIADEDNSGSVSLEEFVDWQREAVEKAGISKTRFIELVTKLSALLNSLFTLETALGTRRNIVKKSDMRDDLAQATAPLRDKISNLAVELYAGDESDAKEAKTPWEKLPPHICKQTLLREHAKTPLPTYNVEEINFCVFPCVPEIPREDGPTFRRRHAQTRWFSKVVRRVHYKAREAVDLEGGTTSAARNKGKKTTGKAKAKPKAKVETALHKRTSKEDIPDIPTLAAKPKVDATSHFYVYEEDQDGFYHWQILKDGKEYAASFDPLSLEMKIFAILLTEVDFSTHCNWTQLQAVMESAISFNLFTEEQYEAFKEKMKEFGGQALGKKYKEVAQLSAEKKNMLVEKYLAEQFKFMVPETMNILMQCQLVDAHHMWDDREDPNWRESKPADIGGRRDSNGRGASKRPAVDNKGTPISESSSILKEVSDLSKANKSDE